MDVLRAAAKYAQRPAVVSEGITCRYQDLLEAAAVVSSQLFQLPEYKDGAADPQTGPRVAVATPPGSAHVIGTWGTWLAGGVAVPLCLSHPSKQLAHMVEDSQAAVVLAPQRHADTMAPIAQSAGAALQVLDEVRPPLHSAGVASLGPFIAEAFMQRDWSHADNNAALFIYTSGTTGAPKGVVHTHGSVNAQMRALQSAWGISERDRLVHTLPLHHVHGAVAAMHTAHAAGACVEFLPKFSPAAVWDALQRREDPVTVFMGVPTMYNYLLQHCKTMPPRQQQTAREAAARLRLTVSGSAPLPLNLFEAWKQLSGKPLLERYGMTETGMLLSNPLDGERRPGCVGRPLPGVEARLDEFRQREAADVGIMAAAGGELLVRGPNLFREYWRKPEATAEAFTPDGWFRTGDTAKLEGDPPYWKLLGRTSVDMITSGGYRISGLEIENVLLQHPGIREAAVMGIPHPELGEQVAALVAVHEGSARDAAAIRKWALDELPSYQVPRLIEFVDALPRNAMGKVNKKALIRELFQ